MRIYWINPVRNSIKLLFTLSLLVLAGFVFFNGFQWRSHWQQIEQRGKLVVAVRESEGIYWANGPEFTGFEHDLIKELESQLELPIQALAVQNMDDLYRALESGAVDMAMPGTSIEANYLPASRPYGFTQIGLVESKDRPEEIEQFRTGILDPNAHHQSMLSVLSSLESGSAVYEPGRHSAELLTLLEMSELEQVLLDERDFKLQQNIFPHLRFTALDQEPRPISVIFKSKEDGSLKERVNAAISTIEASGLLVQMHDRYFGKALEFDFVDNLTFEKHVIERLPQYEQLFQKYAALHDMDWRLLAAVAYQESHWRANARSPTGVRGLMMVTLNTAAEVGITNRLDPEQSTKAGAQYLASLKSRVPERITDPDRTWFALAAYNVGAGHLEDARKITQLLGDDPDRWIDVRKHLPKLALKDYYPWTKHGYARGSEPVVYVANIRRFYEKLKKEYSALGEVAEPERLDQLPEVTVPVFPGQ